MPALYPSAVAPEDFKVGDNVKRNMSHADGSPEVGRVTAVVPKTYKVWVAWPMGEPVQHAPEDLILTPKYQGTSSVTRDIGLSSYDKEKSAEIFGTMTPERREKVIQKLAQDFSRPSEVNSVVSGFSKKASDMLMNLSGQCKNAGLSEMQAYGSLYNAVGANVGDEAIRVAIKNTYK